ncbi:MAG: hypothetical protein J5606_00175 [Bacteroidales bacterium]|nr:hypothetical protein [Bacteroidales bacterium]
MFTQRKKQHILFFASGFFCGILLSAIVAYFSIIKQFTKKQIEKIDNIYPFSGKDSVATTTYTLKKTKKQNPTKNDKADMEANIDITDHISPKDSIYEDFEIQSDRLIRQTTMIVHHQNDSLSKDISEEIIVEQWENPMQFVGYKLNKNTLILYGLEIADIDLFFEKETLFLVVGKNKVALKNNDTFLHFPTEFLKQNIEVIE